MKYNIENLLKIKEYGEALCGGVKIGQLYINRTICVLHELEELEAVLASPDRTDADIAKHMQLVRDFRNYFAEQLKTVETIRGFTKKIAEELETEYNYLVNAIKS